MSDPKRQHWVPQAYLKYFATPESHGSGNEKVWAFSRDKSSPAEVLRPSLKCVAAENFLYSPRNSDGSRDFQMERKLCELEGTIAQLWPELAGMQIGLTKPVRKILSLFIATLYLRHPERRRENEILHRRLVDSIDARIKDAQDPSLGIDVVVKGRKFSYSIEEFEAWKNADANELHRSFVGLIRSESAPLANVLLKKRWSIIVAEEPIFVSSDNPVILRGPPDQQDRFGFGTPGMSVKFPLTPTMMLYLDDKTGANGRYCPLKDPPGMTYPPWAPFNWEVWVNASRFMFSPDPSDVVLAEIMAFHDSVHGNH